MLDSVITRRYIRSVLLAGALLELLILSGLFYAAVAPKALVLLVLLLTVPSIQLAQSLVSAEMCRHASGRILSRCRPAEIDSRGGFQQVVVLIPVIIENFGDCDAAVESLASNYEQCPAGVRARLLVDLCDSELSTHDCDGPLLERLRKKINELRERYDGDPELDVYIRNRIYNPIAEKWMGWERKRGKLEEFFSLICDAKSDTSFTHVDKSSLRGIKYALVLDRDSRLTPGALLGLLATAMHPENEPRYENGVISEGFAVITPRLAHASCKTPTWFSKLTAPEQDVTSRPGFKSSFLQDVFGESMFYGKGLLNIDAFFAGTARVIRANSVLSHDHLEGILTRVGFVSDVVVLEENPDRWSAWYKRQERWTRGDFLLLPWVANGWDGSPVVSARRISYISRWVLLENFVRALHRPLLTMALVVILLAATGPSAVFAAIVLLGAFNPAFYSTLIALGSDRILRTRSDSAESFRIEVVRLISAFAFSFAELLMVSGCIVRVMKTFFVTRQSTLDWSALHSPGARWWITFSLAWSAVFLALALLSPHKVTSLVFMAIWFLGPLAAQFSEYFASSGSKNMDLS